MQFFLCFHILYKKKNKIITNKNWKLTDNGTKVTSKKIKFQRKLNFLKFSKAKESLHFYFLYKVCNDF